MRKLLIVSLLVIFALYNVRADNEQKIKCVVDIDPPCSDDDEECKKAATTFQACVLKQPCKKDSNEEESIKCLQNCKGDNPKIQEYVQDAIDCINSQTIIIFSGAVMSLLIFLF